MAKRCRNDLSKVFKDADIDDRIARKRIENWQDIDELVRVDQIFKNQP
jgi:hypothetical protein